MEPLSREFLLSRGKCCNSGCKNCPYKKRKVMARGNYDILIKENFLSKEECNWWIDAFKTFECKKELLGSDRKGKETIVEILHIRYIWQLQKAYVEFQKKLSGHHPKDLHVNYAHVVKWIEGMSMGSHKDIYDTEYTSLIYLNDSYEGGETFIGDTIIKPTQGKLVSWWGAHLEHGANRVENGTRYTLPIWYTSKEKLLPFPWKDQIKYELANGKSMEEIAEIIKQQTRYKK